MQMPLPQYSRCLLIVVVSSLALSSTGCRSTRSGLSQLPGMAWAAPSDVETFGGWDETGEPALPPPSSNATPQLASESGTSALSSPAKVAGTKPKSATADAPALTQNNSDYPDTGYPTLRQPSPPASTGEHGDASNTHNALGATRPGSSYQVQDHGHDHDHGQQPERGFYGDKYGGEQVGQYGPPAPSAETLAVPVDRPADTGTKYSGYESPALQDGPSRYAASDGLPSPPIQDRFDSVEPLVSDTSSRYEPYGGQPDTEQPPPTAPPYASDLEDRPGLADNVQEMARQAGEKIEQGAAGVGRGMRNGMSRFSSRWGDDSQDPASGTPHDEQMAHQGAGGLASDSTEVAEPGSSDLSGPATSPYGRHAEVGTERRPRSRLNDSWRPGSTGSYPSEDPDQTRYPSTRGYGVEPASYPRSAESDSRFTPSYR